MIKNDLIELTVEFAHLDSGSYVEVSGSASQTGGAYANFYDVAEIPANLSDPGGPNPSVTVSAHSLPPNRFTKEQDVTCVIRTGKIWLTVLGQGPQAEISSDDGSTKWNVIKAVSHITDGDSWKEADDS
jgi:hypothetical protein